VAPLVDAHGRNRGDTTFGRPHGDRIGTTGFSSVVVSATNAPPPPMQDREKALDDSRKRDDRRKSPKRDKNPQVMYPYAPSGKSDDTLVRAMTYLPHAFDPPPPPARVDYMPFQGIPVQRGFSLLGEVRDGAVILPATANRPLQAGLKVRQTGTAGVERYH